MIIHKEKIIVLIISLVLSFLLYGNSIKGDFVSDDKLIILRNPLVSGNFSDFFKTFSTPYYHNQPHAGLYRPLTIASYNLNRVFSQSPVGFHLLNVILNAINGFLVFLLVSKLANKRTAYVAIALFMFLPIHSEAVSAIVGRAELLAFLFSVLSLLCILDKRYVLASLLLLMGLLSKETAAGFFLVFLYIWKFKERQTLKNIFYNSFYFIPAVAIYATMRALVLGKYFVGVDHLMAYNPLKFAPFFDSLWTSLKVFYLYLLKTVVPYQLSSDYSFNQIPIIKNPFLHYEVYLGVFILAVATYLIIKRRNTFYGLSAAIFLLTYLLVSNWLVKIGTIMGERLMYAPSLGLVVLAALSIDNYLLSTNKAIKRLIYGGLIVLLSWYGYVIIDRNRDWRNEKILLTSGYMASPNSVVSITNMAFLDFNDDNYVGASQWAEKAIKIFPDHMPAIFLAGHAYKKLGNSKLAESLWLRVFELNPNYDGVHLSLGVLYYEQGRFGESESILAKGFELQKTWGKAFPLALVKINMGKYDDAIRLIISNFGENPEKRELKFALGLAYLKKGDKQKAEFYLSPIKDPGVSMEDYLKKVINQKVFKISEY
ncbi:MAG: tetratricopeptide repeat protein [bacterium]|nr:tetratricopeptide repeat protein [bacterium]